MPDRTHPRPPGRDHLTPEQRSDLMRRIRGKDTKPELVVRRLAHAMGYRFRLHRRDLPGSPDLVFPGRRKVVFVHGCFWHAHGCQGGRVPATRPEFWAAKFEGNKRRDRRSERRLRRDGWGVMTVWECQTAKRKLPRLAGRLVRFLEAR